MPGRRWGWPAWWYHSVVVPQGEDGQVEHGERQAALDGGWRAVLGVPGAEEVLAVLDRLLDGPPVGVAGDDCPRGGGGARVPREPVTMPRPRTADPFLPASPTLAARTSPWVWPQRQGGWPSTARPPTAAGGPGAERRWRWRWRWHQARGPKRSPQEKRPTAQGWIGSTTARGRAAGDLQAALIFDGGAGCGCGGCCVGG